ncbi:MAG TPA: OsmC family protein [Solirubrobacteraceae bacterium]|nr:OsmC family protein [Solirubrobacteraceae bacterium]
MPTRVRHREFHFPVQITYDDGLRATARVEGKPPLRLATPPEFRGEDPDQWSPEDALVTAAASCLAVTIAGLAHREGLPLHHLDVQADGVVGRRSDGRFGFVRIEQRVTLATDPGREDAARALAGRADEMCLVTASLDLPAQTTVDVRALSPAK